MWQISSSSRREFNRYYAYSWGSFAETRFCLGNPVAPLALLGVSMQLLVALLQVSAVVCVRRRGDDFRLRPIPLTTIRPLLVEEVCLADLCAAASASASTRSTKASRVQPEEAEAEADREIWRVLTDHLEKLLSNYEEAHGLNLDSCAEKTQQQPLAPPKKRGAFQLFCNYRGATQDIQTFAPSFTARASQRAAVPRLPKHRLPLVRLRVENSGYSTISAARFGLQFVNRVANPDSLLKFYKKRYGASV